MILALETSCDDTCAAVVTRDGEVRVSNEGAIKLYESLGFHARGVRRGYYTDNREDAVIMWKDPARSEAESA